MPNGILPLKMEESLVAMAKFRNRLVHGYMSIDRKFLYDILDEDLDMLKQVAEILINKISKL